jgi:cardiolipin synthase
VGRAERARRAGPLPSSVLAVFLAGLAGGCATLPDTSRVMAAAPPAPERSPVVSARGLLPPEESRAILARLERAGRPTDLLERLTAVTETVSDAPLTEGNKVTLLVDGPATYAAMLEAIGDARDHVDFETYLIEDDEVGRRFAAAFARKRAEGVQVNLIHDSVGSAAASTSFFQRLKDAGVQVVEFNRTDPFEGHGKWDLLPRDHRKILVVDGKVAFTGGVNVTRVYSPSPSGPWPHHPAPAGWRDTDVRIEGPAVAELQRLFLATWEEQRGPKLPPRTDYPPLAEKGDDVVQVLASSPGQANRITFVMYAAAIAFAEHSIHLTSAYFVPDQQILSALEAAARRGVDVRLVLPSRTDSRLALEAQRYTYDELLEAGVRIHERKDAVLHAKTAVVDEVWSTVGSTNMDYLSFLSNDEVNAVVLGHPFAAALEGSFASDLAASEEIRPDRWKRRPLSERLREWSAHLLLQWL